MKYKLAKATFEDDVVLVNSIVKEGIDLNYIDELGKTVLMHAIEQENIRLIELFINLGADVNISGSSGFTALHHAVDISIDGTIQTGGKFGEEPLTIIKYLLEQGADKSALTNKKQTPLDIANQYKSKKVATCLILN